MWGEGRRRWIHAGDGAMPHHRQIRVRRWEARHSGHLLFPIVVGSIGGADPAVTRTRGERGGGSSRRDGDGSDTEPAVMRAPKPPATRSHVAGEYIFPLFLI